jgi:putative ABC transport system permease protein
MFTELWSDVRYRVRALLRRAEVERELDDELRFHLARETERYEQLGYSRSEAERRARIAFGGVDRAKEESRDGRGTIWLETVMQDLRYAVRGLRRTPLFAGGVVLTLALGIGANATMFGIIDELLFRPPAYLRDPAHVHRVYLTRTRDRVSRTTAGFQFPRYRDLMRWTHSFSSAAAFTSRRLAVGDGEAARERVVVGASASYFGFFDATPSLGRFFTAAEDSVPAGAPVAVLGYGYWQQELGGRRDVLGQPLRIGHTLCTIIGVAPPGFRGVEEQQDPDLFIPLTTFGMDARGPSYVGNYGFHWLEMIVRRLPRVTSAAADADLTAAYERSWLVEAAKGGESPLALTNLRARIGPVQSARGPLAGPESKLAAWSGGVTLIVLLIACANVANLLLARATVRRREIALRRALGVGTGRLVRQLLTEAALLAVIGGAIGLAIAQWGGAAIRSAFLARDVGMAVAGDRRTLVVTLALTLVAALASGAAPVLHAARDDLSRMLVGAGRDTGLPTSRTRAVLLVMQAALSFVLLVGAGLFVRSLERVRALRLGYDVDPVLLVTDNRRGTPLDSVQHIALEDRLVSAAQRVPGVVGASVVSSVPFWGFEGRALYVAGIDSVDLLGNFDLQAVGPEYFNVMGTRILRGRAFDEHDLASSPAVTIVSAGMASALWPGQEPLGKCFRVETRSAPCATVVGVAEDLRLHSFTRPHEYIYYLPITQFAMSTGMLVVRVAGDANHFAEPVRRTLQKLMPGTSYVTVQRFATVIDPAMRSWSVGATIFVAFGTLALVLAALGLYSVIAYTVAQRRREIGVRIALGASSANVVGLVVRGGMRLIVVGIASGALAALLAGQGVSTLLFQETPNDPTVYLGVATVLLFVSVLATALPALAASRVDPNLCLRTD